jgi:acetoin utilization deacetylase AcuC-like enzyme
MIILHDPATLAHRTVELLGAKIVDAHEDPERIVAILNALKTAPQHKVLRTSFQDSDLTHIRHVDSIINISHDPGYLRYLQTAHSEWVKAGLITEDESILPECFRVPVLCATENGDKGHEPPKDVYARPGYYSFDMSSGIAKNTWPSIIASANLAIVAAKALLPDAKPDEPTLDYGEGAVLALCRPPGHHCTTAMAGGYCYMNNAVLAVDAIRHRWLARDPRGADDESAQEEAERSKIAILDIDFHHGNGTQDAYYEMDEVFYVSIHGEDEYPYYSGKEEEIGSGQGRGYTCNFPLKTDSTFQEYMTTLQAALGEIKAYEPRALLISLGFDTYHLDPLGKFQIETEHYGEIAKAIRSSEGAKDLPCLILLEGGYVIEHLGANMLSFLEGWEKADWEKDGDADGEKDEKPDGEKDEKGSGVIKEEVEGLRKKACP